MDIKEMGYGYVAWINPAQRKDKWRSVVNTEPSGSVKYKELFE